MRLIEADENYDLWKCWKPWGCGRELSTLPMEEL